MRKILFRGKTESSKTWVFGYYVFRGGVKHQIVTDSHVFPFVILPETLGQFTGLLDKNGKEIFEGDIVRKYDPDYNSDAHDKWAENGYMGDEPMKEKVDYVTLENWGTWLSKEFFGWEGEGLESPEDWEIIGNIHDNPELLQ